MMMMINVRHDGILLDRKSLGKQLNLHEIHVLAANECYPKLFVLYYVPTLIQHSCLHFSSSF